MKAIFFLVFLPLFQSALAKDLASPKEMAKAGAAIYMQNCTACHGPQGDGRGPAAVAIQGGKKPRDFTTGKYKFGDKPEEIFKTITNGSPGTAMPGWSSLSEDDRWALAYYVKSLKKEN